MKVRRCQCLHYEKDHDKRRRCKYSRKNFGRAYVDIGKPDPLGRTICRCQKFVETDIKEYTVVTKSIKDDGCVCFDVKPGENWIETAAKSLAGYCSRLEDITYFEIDGEEQFLSFTNDDIQRFSELIKR